MALAFGTASAVLSGHAFNQNLRRVHYQLGRRLGIRPRRRNIH